MPQVIADVFERPALTEQPRRTRMAERVRPVMPQRESSGAEYATGEVIEAPRDKGRCGACTVRKTSRQCPRGRTSVMYRSNAPPASLDKGYICTS